MVIIDVQLQTSIRIIGVYRINPTGNVTQHAFFTSQLNLIKHATEQRGNKKVIILSDFNLNEAMKFNNILCNRLTVLNKLLNLDWLNLSLIAFIMKAKNTFLIN